MTSDDTTSSPIPDSPSPVRAPLRRSLHPPRRRFLVGVLLLVVGCGMGGDEGANSGPVTSPSDLPEGTGADTSLDGLELRLGIPKLTFAPGEPIEVVLLLANRSGETRTLSFSSSQRFDLVLRNAEGSVETTWSASQLFLQALGTEVIAPGGELRFEANLPAPERTGDHTLEGSIPATGSGSELHATLPLEVRE
jgi:hypothetical protein